MSGEKVIVTSDTSTKSIEGDLLERDLMNSDTVAVALTCLLPITNNEGEVFSPYHTQHHKIELTDKQAEILLEEFERYGLFKAAFRKGEPIIIDGTEHRFITVTDLGRLLGKNDLLSLITEQHPDALVMLCVDDRYTLIAKKIVQDLCKTEKIAWLNRAGLGVRIPDSLYPEFIETSAGSIIRKNVKDVVILAHSFCAAAYGDDELANKAADRLKSNLEEELERKNIKVSKEEGDEGVRITVYHTNEVSVSDYIGHIHTALFVNLSHLYQKDKAIHGVLKNDGVVGTLGFSPMFCSYDTSGALHVSESSLSLEINEDHGLAVKEFSIILAVDEKPIQRENGEWVVPSPSGGIPEISISKTIKDIQNELKSKYGNDIFLHLPIAIKILIMG